MKKLALISAGLAMTITGCVTPTEKNRFQLEVSQQICNVDALAKEKQTSLAVTNSSKYSIREYQNKHGSFEEKTDTILMEKLDWYEAEIEASYRFVTQQCGAYMRCIERNNHNEWSCKRSEERWNSAQERFNKLSRDIRVIAAQVERERIRADHHRNHRRHGPNYPGGCCSTVNSVFTDCCG